jgi:hypothetical protein
MRPSAILKSVLLLLMLVGGGCHKLLGDYTLDGAPSTGCQAGSLQCVGNVLQGCDSLGTGWNNNAVCASEALCDPAQGACRPPMCGAGQRRCQGAELQICNATRDGWDHLQTCATAGRCSGESGSCTDEPCEPGMLQCNGPLLQSCKDDRSGWDDLAQCASSALCDKASRGCTDAACQPGEFSCDGAQLQVCNDAQSGWTAVRTCNSEALCDAVHGSCGAVACTTAGAFSCSESGALERCADDLTGWALLDTCKSAAHCDAVNGACTQEPCQAGARQCSGATLNKCKEDRSGWEKVATCETDALCQQTLSAQADTCVAPACEIDAVRCVDEQPQICNAGRTDYRSNGAACVTAALCNGGTGTCNVPICMPGDARCMGAQPVSCNPGLTSYVANGPACASVALCNQATGTCGNKKCSAGQLRCDPANPTHLQRCNADLTDWESSPCDICDTPELCSASVGAATCDSTSCKEPVCKAGQPRCGGTGNDQGRVLEMCNAGRTGYQGCQTCVTSDLCSLSLSTQPFVCSPTACTAPSCALTDRWCGGTGSTGLYQCPASRINSRATLLDTCATNELCERTHSSGKTECEEPSCAIGDLWCGGTGNRTLYQCPSSRINSQATALGVCASAGLCESSRKNKKTTCEAPACAAGDTQCAGTASKTLQACNSDLTGFTDCATCATAELCTDSLSATTCNASACLTCSTGEARCNAAGNYESCRSDRKGFDVTDCLGNGCEATSGCVTPAAGGAPAD